MNLNPIFRNSFIAAGMALLIMLFTTNPLAAQDHKSKENSGTQKTIRLHVVTDENGKVTKTDTTITTGGDEGMTYEYNLEALEDQMKDLEDQMQEFEVMVDNGKIIITDTDTDSTPGNDTVEKRIIIRHAPGMGRVEMPDHFMYFDKEIPCPPVPGWCDEDFNMALPGQLPPQWQALLGSMTLGHITGFKVVEKKGGKRIIIDMDDDPVMMRHPMGQRHGHGPKRVIIEKNIQVPPPPDTPAPPPPPAPKEQQEPPQGKKG